MNRHQPTPSFGLIAWLEQTKIALPLKGVETRFEVTAGVASVEIDQIYHQSHGQPLDFVYTFPLPAEAAVYRCKMHVNDRVIRAKVEGRDEARRVYAEQTAAGHRAALVEVERDNLFTLSLGNLQPDDVVVIRLAYFQTLDRESGEQRLRVPVCPGVRYIPGKPLLRSLSGRGVADDTDQVPDASRIAPPRISALDPQAAYFSAMGRLTHSDVAADSLSSPSHPLRVETSEGHYTVNLPTHGEVPDRDLVILWKEPADTALAPRAWSYRADGATYALVQLRAPAEVAVAEDYPQDFYFLVDRSGSMEGKKWNCTCEALTAFVRLLGAQDRVWITLFESAFLDYAEKPLAAPQVLADSGFQNLVRYGTAGGTELLPAIEHVSQKIRQHSSGRPPTVIIITDGQVGNEAEILKHYRLHADVAVHTFGIDTVVNDAFLKQLARQQGGGCWLRTPDDNIADTISSLADRLRRPVLTQLALGPGWESAARHLPNVHARQVIDLCLRADAPEVPALELTGSLQGAKPVAFPIAPLTSSNPALELLWARERIASLLAEERKDEAVALAKRHNLLCEGAAFIAWDDSEKVEVAGREIVQPSIIPAMAPAPAQYAWAPSPAPGFGGGFKVRALFNPKATQRFTPPPAELEAMADPAAPASSLVDDLIDAGLNGELAEALFTWSEAKWLRKTIRRRALRALIMRLEKASKSAERAVICRVFIERNLSGDSEASSLFLEQVARWETNLSVPTP